MKIVNSLQNFKYAINKNLEFVKNFIDHYVYLGNRMVHAKKIIVNFCIRYLK